MSESLEATYRIVTPMFIGGADQTPGDGLRPPSFKGALRFWWRALNWSDCLQLKRDESKALQLLHQREAQLFGIAADGEVGGQGRFLLKISHDGDRLPKNHLPSANAGHQYLLGQGLYHFKERYLREALAPAELRVTLRFRPGTTQHERTSVAKALLALGVFGGLGSRSRKGFGALAIQSLEGVNLRVPVSANEVHDSLAALFAVRTEALPPFTAFSAHTRIDLVAANGDDVWQLLGKLGAEMQRYRSWGQNGKVAGTPAEQNFPGDHDLAQQAAAGNTVHAHPRRAIFGLPHNYFFSSTKNKLDVNALAPKPDGNGWSDLGTHRRASPLFLHPHQFPDGSIAAVIALLPAQFLPDTWRIGLKGKKPPMRVETDPDWSVLHGFMDRFTERRTLLECRP